MIILEKDNSKKIYGNKYLYNLICDKNINIKNIVVNSNLKKNITFGFVGKKDIHNLNIEYDEDETIIDLNINLLKGNNYIYIYSVDINFKIIIDEDNIKLGNIKYKIFNTPYILNKSNYYDLFINKNKLYFLAYINDSSDDDYYEIKINKSILNKYTKYDNFYNFIGSIDIIKEKLYTLEINMKYLIPIINFIKIYNNIIEDKTSYDNNLNNMYNMNPIISYKDIKLNAYYIEIKFEKYNNYTRLSFDKDDKIVLKIIDDILLINDKKILKYNNQYLKFVLSYNSNINKTDIYLFNEFSNDLSNKKQWEKKLTVNSRITFYQKLYETQYYDSHINSKVVIFKKPYIFNCDNNKYIDNIDFKYFDNIPLIYLNNYKLQLGGDINKNNSIQKINVNLDIINKNKPISIDTIDSNGNKIVRECNDMISKSIVNNNDITTSGINKIVEITSSTSNKLETTSSTSNKVETTSSTSNKVETTLSTSNKVETTSSTSNKIKKLKYISNNNININNYFNNVLNNKFLFEFDDKNPGELLKAITLITILFVIYIKMFN